MDEQIIRIASRLRGLREALGLSPEELAPACGVTLEEYNRAEGGDTDISVGFLQAVARHTGVGLDVLLFGEEPRVSTYFLTRAGKGVTVERIKAYKYQSLASGFINRKSDLFMVTVEPKGQEEPFTFNSHPGQEFNMVMSGSLLLSIDGKELILHKGDSIYFDASRPHGMKALGGQPVEFLAIIV